MYKHNIIYIYIYVCIYICMFAYAYIETGRDRDEQNGERGSERQREVFKIGLCDSAGFCCCSVAKLFLTL